MHSFGLVHCSVAAFIQALRKHCTLQQSAHGNIEKVEELVFWHQELLVIQMYCQSVIRAV